MSLGFQVILVRLVDVCMESKDGFYWRDVAYPQSAHFGTHTTVAGHDLAAFFLQVWVQDFELESSTVAVAIVSLLLGGLHGLKISR